RDGRVAPGALGGVGDAAELGDHHGRVRVHVLGGVVDRAASLRPAPGDRLRGRLLVGVVGGEAVGVGGVVVQGDDVAAGELVAVVGDDGPAGVQGAGQRGQGDREVLLRGVVGEVAHAPGLVHRHPGDHARVGAHLLDDL